MAFEGPVFNDIGLMAPQVLLPTSETDMTKWSVIACDQYTSEGAYWKRVEELVGESPSMLRLIYPEVFLPEKRDEEIIAAILEKMKEYPAAGVLEKHDPGFVLVDRKTPSAESRLGLVVALDLELYSFEKGSQSLIRPTEKTIEARLPPRIAVRKDAPFESPHILVLIDDPEKTVIEPLMEKRNSLKKLYDFELMEKSGHLAGYHVSAATDMEVVVESLRKLATKDRFQAKYGAKDDQNPILFAVGDGNHSLATAKRCWETLKANGAKEDHPSRFALVEINNVHDDGLKFHPIHRLIEGVNPDDLFQSMQKFFEAEGSAVSFEEGARLGEEDVNDRTCGSSLSSGSTQEDSLASGHCHQFEFLCQSKRGVVNVARPKRVLAVATLDAWLNGYVSEKEAELDYVHEEYTIEGKTQSDDRTMGFLLPTIDKNDLVRTVVKEGVLPRKTFSMGHAPEKRFYCECRKFA